MDKDNLAMSPPEGLLSKKIALERVIAELNLNVRDPFTRLIANTFALYDQREQFRAYIATIESSQAQAVREEIALRTELVEAWEAAIDWGGYAGEYFQKKHGFADDLKKLEEANKALDRARASVDKGGGV